MVDEDEFVGAPESGGASPGATFLGGGIVSRLYFTEKNKSVVLKRGRTLLASSKREKKQLTYQLVVILLGLRRLWT